MVKEYDYENDADSTVLIPFERSLGNRAGDSISAETQVEDELNFNIGREGLCINGSSSFRIPYNASNPINWHQTWTICFWIKIDSFVDIQRFPQILFNTNETLSTSTEQLITCSFLEEKQIQFSVNNEVRNSIADSLVLDKWHFVSIIHVPNSKIRIFINNEDKTSTYTNNGRLTTAISRSDNDIIFFKKVDNTLRSSHAVKMYGFRFYNRELSTQELNILFGISTQSTTHTEEEYAEYVNRSQTEAKSLPSTFGGNVVKVTKNTSNKKILVHNYIQELNNIQTVRTFTNTTIFSIISRLMDDLTDLEFIYLGRFTDIWIRDALVSGSIIDLIKQYMSNTKHRFYVNTSKQLVFQTNKLFNNNYTFEHGVNSVITMDTQDSTSIVNEVISVEDGELYNFIRTHAYSWGDWSKVNIFIRNSTFVSKVVVRVITSTTTSNTYTAFPFNGTVTRSGVNFAYRGDVFGSVLRFRVTPSNPDTTLDVTVALDIEYAIPTKREIKFQNQRSVALHGTRSKIISDNSDSTVPIIDRIKHDLSRGNLRTSYKIICPRLLLRVRVGDYCVITNKVKGYENLLVQVTKIQWSYPEGKTILRCGDTEYDIYTTFAQIGDAVKSVLTQAADSIPVVPENIDPNDLLQ